MGEQRLPGAQGELPCAGTVPHPPATDCWSRPAPSVPPPLQSLKRKGCGPGSSSEHTRTAITGALKKKLKDLMGEFQDLRCALLAPC